MPVNPIREAEALCEQLDREMAQQTLDEDTLQAIGDLDPIGGLGAEGFVAGFNAGLESIRENTIDESGCSLGGRGGNDPDSYYPEWLEKQAEDAEDDAARRWIEDARAILDHVRQRQQQMEAA